MGNKILYAALLAVFSYLEFVCIVYYEGNIAFFPQIVLGVGITLCIMKLLCLYYPKIAKILDAEGIVEYTRGQGVSTAQENALGLDEDDLELGLITKTDKPKMGNMDRFKKELFTIGWASSLVLAIYLFGFYVAAPLMVFLYIKVFNKEPWLKSTLVSGALPLVLYFGFNLGLKINLYTGLFFR